MKPTSKQELEEDIKAHPERGKVEGINVVSDQKQELRVKVSAEIKRKFLRIIGCYGIDSSSGIEQAIILLWNEHRAAVESSEEEKAIKLNVSVEQIQSKTYGHAKARARQKRLNLAKEENKEENNE